MTAQERVERLRALAAEKTLTEERIDEAVRAVYRIPLTTASVVRIGSDPPCVCLPSTDMTFVEAIRLRDILLELFPLEGLPS